MLRLDVDANLCYQIHYKNKEIRMSDTTPDMHKALFANLVMMLSSSAMQQLGKLINPMTNKTEVSLEGARMTIDMLEMIDAKTKGNLDEGEEKMMKELLSTLQMNFVETSQNPPAETPEEKPEEIEEKKEETEEKKEETPEAPAAEEPEKKAKKAKKDK